MVMGERRRLTGQERRESILRAARRVFAENGFRGTTTRALAEAAGVSEALLFKHFPSKEALYGAMLATYTGESDPDGFRDLMALPPSTATLVRVVHSFYARLIEKRGQPPGVDDAILARLMAHSLTEDGEFARLFLRKVSSRLVFRLEACLPAAAAAGDLDDGSGPHQLTCWFTHHLAVTLLQYHLADQPVIDYGVPKATLVEQAVRFALRGIGLKPEAIRREYHPEEWDGSRP
jgi:AcrR family transcriptional regulator